MLNLLYSMGPSRLLRSLSNRFSVSASLDDRLSTEQVGAKAANLAKLRRWGYAVPSGWLWRTGDDRESLAHLAKPSPEQPLIVRSSATGEDSHEASAAGQYDSIGDVIDRASLDRAIDRCVASYDNPNASRYRRDRGIEPPPEASDDAPPIALLIQRQIRGVISGVAFSRDPIEPGPCVAIEVVRGGASALVSGRVTPARYDATVPDDIPSDIPILARDPHTENDAMPSPELREWLSTIVVQPTNPKAEATQTLAEIESQTLDSILRSVAAVARQLEHRDRGTPQDIEWTYDGHRLWLLQARPITTLWPLWTRRIAAEVAPGAVQPLAWSISQPLTCGIWGEIFTTVLGDRATGLEFGQTATLHASHAYFNASLLGDIFLRMGLPPESLEFLLRDRPMSKPSLRAMLANVPGLLRLVHQQMQLIDEFARDDAERFTPLLDWLAENPLDLGQPKRTPEQLLARADRILAMLRPVTHYNILVPIGLAIRQKLAGVTEVDGGEMPEVEATRTLQDLARDLQPYVDGYLAYLPDRDKRSAIDTKHFRAWLETGQDSRDLLSRFDRWLERYGYLSDVGTNIAVATWRETPEKLLQLWWQSAQLEAPPKPQPDLKSARASQSLQEFARLKGRVAVVYDRLLAELRWCFVAIERHWRSVEKRSLAPQSEPTIRRDDIFFLTLEEVCQYVVAESRDSAEPKIGTPAGTPSGIPAGRIEHIRKRRERFDRDRQRSSVPRLVYGDILPERNLDVSQLSQSAPSSSHVLTGIGASRGRVYGRIAIVHQLEVGLHIDRETILVVPYTDAGWSPLLAQAGGLISAVGGRLSHGAIVAREYGIPAVMDVADAFERLHPGQWVWLDGESGAIELA